MLPKVLVIDDDDLVLDLVRDALGGRFDLIFASTAEGAIAAAGRWEFSVVCCDYTMPGMNGSEILQAIHEQIPQTRSLLLTDSDFEAAKSCTAAFAVVSKPFRPTELAELIEALAFGDSHKAQRYVDQWGTRWRRPTLKPEGF